MVDRIYLYMVWALGAILFAFAVPRTKRRVAQIAFLFKQFLTWVLGLIVVEFHLIEYPVRFFATVNRSSFTFEYFAYPCICGIFNARYPEKRSVIYRFCYFSVYCSIMTIVEVWLKHNTQLIRYIHWEWYWTWISLFLTFCLSRLFTRWFFAKYAFEQTQERTH